jgi:DUF1680 family protein
MPGFVVRLICIALAFAKPLAALATPASHAAPEEVVNLPVPHKAQTFPAGAVTLLDGPFKVAQEIDHAYLLRLDPDRLLAWFRKEAGLKPKAEVYGGWEQQGVAGHTAGHYLTAASLMYRATGDHALLDRVNYMVGELDACQRGNGNGYVAAIPEGKAIFADVAAGKPIRGWVPWYTIHKLMGGLRDAYLLCGSEKARLVLTRLADWAGTVVAGLDDKQVQAMLAMEHGGIAETLADTYAITGERKYLDLARRFTHHALFDPFSRGQDCLDDLHANTQIPKFVGYERIYELSGDAAYHAAAANFWSAVVDDRSWVIGGNSQNEAFFAAGRWQWAVEQACGPETCNTYNMLRLTNRLFLAEPSARLADYAERALWNHILSSIDPKHGGLVYYTSMRPGHYRVYSTDFDSFWCCVGTGIESHGKYGEAIFYHADDTLWLNQFIASELNWREKGVEARLTTRFPENGAVKLAFTCRKPVKLTIQVRYPAWAAKDRLRIRINGRALRIANAPGSYVPVARTWTTGDTLEIELPLALRTEPLPHSSRYLALLWGPIVLAGDAGAGGLTEADFHSPAPLADRTHPLLEAPTIVGDPSTVLAHIAPVRGAAPLIFRLSGDVEPGPATLIPLYRLHYRRYNVYWRVQTEAEREEERAHAAAEEAARRELDARTIDRVEIGDAQSEEAHRLQGEEMATGPFAERHWRHGKWMSWELKVQPDAANYLFCTWWGSDDGPREFDIVVEGQVIAGEKLHMKRPGEFVDATYPIPESLTRGKSAVTVRFQSRPGNIAGGIFGLRVVKAGPAP